MVNVTNKCAVIERKYHKNQNNAPTNQFRTMEVRLIVDFSGFWDLNSFKRIRVSNNCYEGKYTCTTASQSPQGGVTCTILCETQWRWRWRWQMSWFHSRCIADHEHIIALAYAVTWISMISSLLKSLEAQI